MTSGAAGIPPSAGVVPGLWTSPSQEVVPGSLFTPARRRQAVVVARDAATRTCSLQVQGDATVHPGQVSLAGYVPRVGDTVWCLQDGPDWLIVGGQGTELPKGKMRSTATQTVAVSGTPEKFNFQATGGSTPYDTDNNGSGSMVDRQNSRLYAWWPGKWLYGYHGGWAANANGRRILDVRINGTSTFLPPRSDTVTADAGHANGSDLREFAAGDFIELFITSTGGTATFGSGIDELGMCLWMHYVP
jgi:hypothetical protein